MKINVTLKNRMTKNFSLDGRYINKFLDELKKANGKENIEKVFSYEYIERQEGSQIGVYKGLKKIDL